MAQVEGYRLSFQQQRLWRLAELCVPSWAQLLLAVDGELDVDRLEAALDDTVFRQEILRSTYQRVPGVHTALLVVHDADQLRPQWSRVDLQHLDDESQWRSIEQSVSVQRDLPHGGPDDPVVRAVLFVLGPCRHALLLSTAALAADNQALRLLAGELARRYAGTLPADEVLQYNQFAEWQHQLSEEEEPATTDGSPPTDRAKLPIPLRRPRAAARVAAGTADAKRRAIGTRLPDGIAADVHAYAHRRRVRSGAVLLACWQAMLWKITGVPDVTVGAMLAGRDYEETTDSFGHYARWASVSIRVGPEPVFDTLVSRAELALSAAEDAQEGTLASYPADTAGWDIRFACQDTPEPMPAQGGATFTVVWDDVESESYSLKLGCVLGAAEARIMWHYDSDQFDEAYVRVLADQYSMLLAQLLATPAIPVRDVRLPGPADSYQPCLPEPPASHCLHRLVEQQVERAPDAVAVVAGTERLTYRELDARANLWARELQARGVSTETPVAVRAEHSVALVVALLAVLKAGGAYVPIDPDLPPLRVRDLLARAGCQLLLTDRLRDDDADHDRIDEVDRVELRGLPPRGAGSEADCAPTSAVRSDNLAYVIFTSGSSGAPKGVMLPHRALCNYLLWSARAYPRGDSDGGALVHSSIAFDLTVTSLFLPLITGQTVHLDPAWRDALALSADLGRRTGLGLLKLTPSHLMVVNHVLEQQDMAGTVRCLVLGGEPLTGEAISGWLAHAPETRVFNEYGPTETAVGVCVHEVGADDGHGPVPIGRAIDHAEVLVLDEALEPVAVGVPGEIYIGGEALARGYLGSPDATAERFVPHPFSPNPGRRLYRTGDLACRGPDGLVRYLGRLDDQIKIRGVRVEPEEIRAALLEHPGVRDAAVVLITDEDRGEQLAAYIVGAEVEADVGSDTAPQALRAFLSTRLPVQLVPLTYVQLDAIPLTPNGKVDRAALPAPTAAGNPARPSGSMSPPSDAAESAVARVFENLLAVPTVGADDDFFALGGHSLLALRLIARLSAEFKVELPVSVLFSEPDEYSGSPASPRRLARLLKGGNAAVSPALPSAPATLVPLWTRGEGTPLFCVHPAGGEVTGFRALASPELRRPLYALQAPPLDDNTAQSIEFLAAEYLAAIRMVRPVGPYLLLGWSMGGVVALEMARLLDRESERTDMLFLVESYLADQLPEIDESPVDEPPAGRLTHADGVPALSADERIRLARRRRTNAAHLLAARAYRPAPYAGPVTLVQASDQNPEFLDRAAEAWSQICGKSMINRHVLQGGHLTLFQPPYVDELVRIIEQAASPDLPLPMCQPSGPGR